MRATKPQASVIGNIVAVTALLECVAHGVPDAAATFTETRLMPVSFLRVEDSANALSVNENILAGITLRDGVIHAVDGVLPGQAAGTPLRSVAPLADTAAPIGRAWR